MSRWSEEKLAYEWTGRPGGLLTITQNSLEWRALSTASLCGYLPLPNDLYQSRDE